MANVSEPLTIEDMQAYCAHEPRCRVRARTHGGKPGKRPPLCLSNRILAVWMLLAIVLLLSANTALLNEAARFAALPMGLFALLLLFDKSCCTHGLFMGKRGDARWPALLLTVAFFVTLSIPNLFSCPLMSNAGLKRMIWKYGFVRYAYLAWNWTGYLLGYALAVYGCLHTALRRFLRPRQVDAGDQIVRTRFLGLNRAVLPLLAVLVMLLFAAKESLFIGDAPTVWYNARDCVWREWHTAGYLLFVKLCSLVWNSQRSVVLAQCVACLYIANYGVSIYRERGFPSRAGYAYIAALLLTFVPLYFLQAVIKDVPFSLSLFAFALGALRLVHAEKSRGRDWVWTGGFGLCACLFRHAGAVPVFVTFFALLFYLLLRRSKDAWRAILAAACVAIGSWLIVNALAYRVLDFERNPGYIAYSAPMTMIGAVAKSGVDIPESDRADMERIMPVEKWADCYEPYFADAISRPYGRVGDDVEKIEKENLGGMLLRLNARFLVRYPTVYLRAFFNLNSLMWEIATPSDGYVRSYLGYVDTPIADFVTQQGYAEDGLDDIAKTLKQPETTQYSGFTALVNRYAEFLYGVPALRDLFWRGGMANLALLLSAVALIKKRRARDLLALVPIATVTLTMLFSMPAQEVRYIFPNLLTAVYFAVYAYFVPMRQGEDGVGH